MQFDRIDRKGKTRFADLELAQRLLFSAHVGDSGDGDLSPERFATAHGTSLTDQFAEFLKDYGLHPPYVLRPNMV